MDVVFKLHQQTGLTRFTTFAFVPSWTDLAANIAPIYRIPRDTMALSYTNIDGDSLLITSDQDLQKFYRTYARSRADGEWSSEFALTVVDLAHPRRRPRYYPRSHAGGHVFDPSSSRLRRSNAIKTQSRNRMDHSLTEPNCGGSDTMSESSVRSTEAVSTASSYQLCRAFRGLIFTVHPSNEIAEAEGKDEGDSAFSRQISAQAPSVLCLHRPHGLSIVRSPTSQEPLHSPLSTPSEPQHGFDAQRSAYPQDKHSRKGKAPAYVPLVPSTTSSDVCVILEMPRAERMLQCRICFDDVPLSYALVIGECAHAFCRLVGPPLQSYATSNANSLPRI